MHNFCGCGLFFNFYRKAEDHTRSQKCAVLLLVVASTCKPTSKSGGVVSKKKYEATSKCSETPHCSETPAPTLTRKYALVSNPCLCLSWARQQPVACMDPHSSRKIPIIIYSWCNLSRNGWRSASYVRPPFCKLRYTDVHKRITDT